MCTNMSASTNGCILYMLFEQEAHGPRRSPEKQIPINKNIFTNRYDYSNLQVIGPYIYFF